MVPDSRGRSLRARLGRVWKVAHEPLATMLAVRRSVCSVQLHAADTDIPRCRTGALAGFLFTTGRSFEARFITFRRHRKLLILDPHSMCMPLMVLGSVAGAAPERDICAGVPGALPVVASVPVRLGQRLAIRHAVYDLPEHRTGVDVVLWAVQRVLDRVSGRFGLCDLCVELVEFAPRAFSPGLWAAGARGQEAFDLGQREPDLAKEQDHSDSGDGLGAVAALPGGPPPGPYEAELVVVAQRRGRDPGAGGDLGDGEQFLRHLTSSVLEVVAWPP